LDYHVLNEPPLMVRRRARNFGVLSTNVLNYSMELTVGLQACGEQATRLTFFYKWQHTWGAIGDRPTLTREAEAFAALGSLQTRVTACARCGAEGVAESRFCRSCGAPLAAAEPAELEVWRLTASVNAAAKANSLGIVMGVLALACLLLSFFRPGEAKTFLLCGSLIGRVVWVAAFVAFSRLAKTLDMKVEREEELLSEAVQLPAAAAHERLLKEPRASVTEATTELLRPVNEPRKAQVLKDKRDASR